MVKVDANTGATIWEFSMPSTDARAGKHSGYESVVFTEDGGFIAGGFAQGWALKNFNSHIVIVFDKLILIYYKLVLKFLS